MHKSALIALAVTLFVHHDRRQPDRQLRSSSVRPGGAREAMTAIDDHRTERAASVAMTVCGPRRTWRSTRARSCRPDGGCRSWSCAIPLCRDLSVVGPRGAGVHELAFLTKDIPLVSRLPGPGMGPAIVGTLIVTAAPR